MDIQNGASAKQRMDNGSEQQTGTWYEGLTANYIRVFCKSEKDLRGNIENIRIDCAKGEFLIGSLLSSPMDSW
jgi:hypothetical protein